MKFSLLGIRRSGEKQDTGLWEESRGTSAEGAVQALRDGAGGKGRVLAWL